MQNPYNFKQVLDHPVTLYRLGKLTLPFGISLARMVLFGVILILMLIFHKPINMVIPYNAQVVVYAGVPFYLSKFFLKFKKDGKKIHRFLFDFTQYIFTIYIPKKRYCNDQEVLYTNDKVTFEPVYMKKGANVDETENADETDLQQSSPYRERRRLGLLQNSTRSDSA